MPVQLHPVEQIVNAHWGGELAVEFGDRDQDAPGSGIAAVMVNELSRHTKRHPRLR